MGSDFKVAVTELVSLVAFGPDLYLWVWGDASLTEPVARVKLGHVRDAEQIINAIEGFREYARQTL